MPTDEHREIAASRKVDCDFEWAKYCDWKRTKGVTHKNPEAGFRNWLRRAEPPPVRRQTREEIARAMFGGLINGTDPSADPKDITGESTRLT
jgi:hypothetical protein